MGAAALRSRRRDATVLRRILIDSRRCGEAPGDVTPCKMSALVSQNSLGTRNWGVGGGGVLYWRRGILFVVHVPASVQSDLNCAAHLSAHQ